MREERPILDEEELLEAIACNLGESGRLLRLLRYVGVIDEETYQRDLSLLWDAADAFNEAQEAKGNEVLSISRWLKHETPPSWRESYDEGVDAAIEVLRRGRA